MCKHKVYNHQSHIYLICLGINTEDKKQKKAITIKIKIKFKKKNEAINLIKILYKTAFLNLQKVNIKSLRNKKEIYGCI